MNMIPDGKYVAGYLASDDLSTAAEVALTDGNGLAYVLAIGERLNLTNIALNNGGTARKITLFSDADGDATLDAGEEIYAATVAANSFNSPQIEVPIRARQIGPTAAKGKLYAVASGASAGSVIVIQGIVTTS